MIRKILEGSDPVERKNQGIGMSACSVRGKREELIREEMRKMQTVWADASMEYGFPPFFFLFFLV